MEHKLGIIGFGGMAEYHYNTVQRQDIGIKPVAVFDVREERRERAVSLGMKAYDDVEEFFKDGGFDLVLVATSNNHHARYACLAMEHGYNVICEKPAAMNADEVRKMIATSEVTGKFFTIHQNRRFDRDFRIIKEAIDKGLVGTPYVIESRIMNKDGTGCRYNWRVMKDHGGGMLPDWGVHMIDQILWLNNDKKVESVYACLHNIASPDDCEDYSKLIIKFEGGLVAQVEVVTYSPVVLPRWIVEGDRGGAIMQTMDDPTAKVRYIGKEHYHGNTAAAYNDNDWYTREQNIREIDEFVETEISDSGLDCDWGSYYKNIVNVLDGKEELLVKPNEVLRCMKVIDAAYESDKYNKVVIL